ncbi:hypothetical protein EYB25_004440 [Talaromyces marneffei]|nr:hypothetical protein EYB25_004440 [Talaromyces marneffei]
MESTGNKSSTSTTNNRLQRSCSKCRVRKIKCDRKNPCTSCILRGCKEQCEYARTDEDRYHIGQAKEIEDLRKELNRLKRRLEDGEQQPQTHSQSQSYGSGAGSETTEAAVTERPSKRRIVENGNIAELWNPTATTAVAGMPYSGNISFSEPEMVQQNYCIPTGKHQPYQQYYADNNNNNNNNPIIKTDHHNTSPPQYNLSQIQQHPQPDFWRGKQKQLETIYKIVCDCNEYWVPSIIDIVRTSMSPEDAIVSIRHLLRSGSSSHSNIYSHSNSNSSNDGGAVPARSTTTTASNSRSPDSTSSIVPVEMDSVPYSREGCDMRFGRHLSPIDQSRSSGEG